MHGTAAGLRDSSPELSALEAQRPELGAWLRPLGAALAALRAEPWCSLAPVPVPVREPGAPLLHGAIVPVDVPATRALLAAVLMEALGAEARELLSRLDPLQLLRDAVAQDADGLARQGAAAGIDPAALSAAAQLAALPLLQRSGRALEHLVAPDWTEGYCPICGAWPALVEVRGLERTRTLRCGRCGSAWTTEVLLCAFCGERDHERLGGLVPEGVSGQTAWVETCLSCGGYLKALATLRGTAPESVPLRDAATIELDLAAAERGFHRPPGSGFAVDCHILTASGAS